MMIQRRPYMPNIPTFHDDTDNILIPETSHCLFRKSHKICGHRCSTQTRIRSSTVHGREEVLPVVKHTNANTTDTCSENSWICMFWISRAGKFVNKRISLVWCFWSILCTRHVQFTSRLGRVEQSILLAVARAGPWLHLFASWCSNTLWLKKHGNDDISAQCTHGRTAARVGSNRVHG